MKELHFTAVEGVLHKIMAFLVKKSQIQVSQYLEVH